MDGEGRGGGRGWGRSEIWTTGAQEGEEVEIGEGKTRGKVWGD